MTKIFGTRGSLIGDIVMSLPILDYLKEKYGNYYLYFAIAQKCQQAAPLFLNHPGINQIKITDYYENLGGKDAKIISTCNIVFNVFPSHPKEQDWYNYRNCVEETALMAGIDPKKLPTQIPKLVQYWENSSLSNKAKTIAVWPFAGYGTGLNRSPSKEWWEKVVSGLIIDGYKVFHFGSPNEPNLILNHEKYLNLTNDSFFEQVRLSLNCSRAIGTDSGSMWVIAAYNKIPQINLMTNWLPNHVNNKLALAPIGTLVKNLYSDNKCDNIDIETVINEINSL
jgi:ADP-heptose:LPS heptosyltransferase